MIFYSPKKQNLCIRHLKICLIFNLLNIIPRFFQKILCINIFHTCKKNNLLPYSEYQGIYLIDKTIILQNVLSFIAWPV